MRILFLSDLADPTRGSLVRQIHAAAQELARRGHEVALFGTHQDAEPERERVEHGLVVRTVRSIYPVRFRPIVGLRHGRIRAPLRAFVESFRPDCVHAHLVHTHLSWSALNWVREHGARVVFTAHDVMSFCYQKMDCFHGGEAERGLGRDWQARLGKCVPCQRLRFLPGRNRTIRRILERSVDVMSAVSHALAARLDEHGIRVDTVVPNAALDPVARPTPEELATFTERHSLGAGPVILFAGRVQAQKGILHLIDVLPGLRARWPDVRLLIASSHDLWDRHAKARAVERCVLDLCRVTGWLDERQLETAYASAHVLCVPSTCFETFGLVHLEAQRRGIPTIGSIYGGVPEVIEEGVTGWIVNPFEPRALERALGALFASPDRARAMGERGEERARTRFALGGMVDGWLALYEKALDTPSRGS